MFAIRKIINKISGEASVWWYRYWHIYFLHLALKRHLKSDDECIIYAQCPPSAYAALRARVSTKQRVIMATHFNISQADEWAGKGMISNNGKLYRAIQSFEEKVLTELDGLVFVSKFMQRELAKRIPSISTIPSAVVPNFLPDPGLTEARPAIADLVCIGSLEARKNQQYLLEILAALRDQGMPLTLTIIGDGPDRDMLADKARALKLNDLVQFTGFIGNAAEQIYLHKACIHVASIENLPVTLIEAMARGRPIFVVPVGGIPEILGDAAVGLALPLNDANLAAGLIAKAMRNREWLAAAGIAARERFLNEYASDVCAKRLSGFLQENLTARPVLNEERPV